MSADQPVVSDQIGNLEYNTTHTHERTHTHQVLVSTTLPDIYNRERNRKYEAFSHSAAVLHMRGDPIGPALYLVFLESNLLSFYHKK